jgi:cytochrome c biogenesis protein
VTSIRFAIVVLCLIALACITGTVVPQQAPEGEYLRLYGPRTYAVVSALRLTDVFHAPWFYGLMGLFSANLFFCTLRRLRASFKTRSRELPDAGALSGLPHRFMALGRTVGEMVGLFAGYRLKRQEKGAVLEKGMVARHAVFIVHASILVILLGGFIGDLFGYRGVATLGRGEIREEAGERRSGRPLALGFGVRLDDFRITFYPSGEPKDYMSRLAIIEGGKVVRTVDVRVNHPVTYRGTTIYQASYGSEPVVVLDVGGEEVRLAEGASYRKGALAVAVTRFEPDVHDLGPAVQLSYLENGAPKTGWLVRDVPSLRQRTMMSVPVRLDAIGHELVTGLEFSRDPGAWIVLTGFVMILLGLYCNFFTYYRRVYLIETPEGVLVAGTAFRNRNAFAREFSKWEERAHDME